MKYQIKDRGIDFAPASEAEEILQNVNTIISTMLGTVPLFRSFGVTWEHLDAPLPVAKTLMQSYVIDAIAKFEPRANVVSVTFDKNSTGGMDGLLSPTVIISIGEE